MSSALLELLKKKKQDMSASRRSPTAKVPEGSSRWRIMPSWRGADQPFWHDFGQHFIKDTTGKIAAIYVCADRTFGRPCSVCDAVAEGIKGATDDATMNALQEAKSGSRILVNALQLSGADPHKMEIAEFPPTVFESIVNIVTEWTEAGEEVLGVNGKDLVITREGKGKNTKYTVQVGAKTTAVPAGVCAKLNDLDAYVAQESSEQQMRALNAVRGVAGLLPAPGSAPAGLPLAARSGMHIEDDSATVSAPPRRAAAPAATEFEDVPDLATVSAPAPVAAAPAPVAAPAPAATVTTGAGHAAAAAAAAKTGDAELDDLLASLG